MAKRSVAVDAAAIEALRAQRGWEQTDLAKEAGVSASTVSRMERANPADTFDSRSAGHIAKALGVPIDAITLGPARLRGRATASAVETPDGITVRPAPATIALGTNDATVLITEAREKLDQLQAIVGAGATVMGPAVIHGEGTVTPVASQPDAAQSPPPDDPELLDLLKRISQLPPDRGQKFKRRMGEELERAEHGEA